MALATPDAAPDAQRPLHHITRIDIEPSAEHPGRHPTHGWQVRHRRDGKRLSKFFADGKHGGKQNALDAAVAYRDTLFASLPEPEAKPRKAWSNTGVVGLSVRAKTTARPKLYVQLNWMDAEGRRKASSFSVEKWGLRRALWNGCLKLYREREAAGYPVEPPHVMFARAQEPFQDQIREEMAAERAAQGETVGTATVASSTSTTTVETRAVRSTTPFGAARTEQNRQAFDSPEAEVEREADRLRKLEDALFG